MQKWEFLPKQGFKKVVYVLCQRECNMIKSIKIKLYLLIEWLVKGNLRPPLFSGIIVFFSIFLSIAIHELGHIISAIALGYEYSLVLGLANNQVLVNISELNYNSLDPLIIGLSGGYFTTAIFLPMDIFAPI